MTAAQDSQELPILRAHYDFVLWMVPKIGSFSREHRHSLGRKMEELMYGILEKLIRARYTRDRRPLLEASNVDLEVLRFHLRLARDLNLLSIRSYGSAAEKLMDIGRQIGGWMRV